MFEQNDADYITINTKDGNKLNAELVSKFEIEGLGEYVIYILDGKLYGAKYKINGENTTLITDLTDQEKYMLNEVLKNLEVE